MSNLYINYCSDDLKFRIEKIPAYRIVDIDCFPLLIGVYPNDNFTIDLYRAIDIFVESCITAREYFESNRLTMLLASCGFNMFLLREEYPELFKYEHQQIKKIG